MHHGLTRTAIAAALFATVSVPALAIDGTILIDQTKALAGNVTPGDTPGFPVTITQPGSYRLASNLRPPALTTAIEITVSNVTIDLNGFGIIGVRSDPPAFSTGIRYVGPAPARNLAIKNGTIADFTFPVSLGGTLDQNTGQLVNGAQALLQDLGLTLGFNGNAGIDLGAGSRVLNVSGLSLSMNVVCPSVVVSSVFNNINAYNNPILCSLTGNATIPF